MKDKLRTEERLFNALQRTEEIMKEGRYDYEKVYDLHDRLFDRIVKLQNINLFK